MDAVGKVQGRGALGHGDDVSLGGEEENFLGEEVGFQGIQELPGIPGFRLPVQHLADPVKLMVQGILLGGTLLIPPVGRDAELRDAVHIPGADLNLEGEGDFAAADNGGVEGLVHVGLGNGDIVLETAGNLVPEGMDDAQDGIAVRDGIHDDADGDEVVDLVELLLLEDHFAVNRIEMLAAAVDGIADALLVQALGQLVDDEADVFLPLLALHADEVDDAVIGLGIDILEGEVLELLLDGIDAEAVGQGRVNIQRFPGDGGAALLRLMTEGAHVVEAVRQLDEHDADVLGHGEDHLAERLGLGFLPVGEVHFIQLGDAVHEIRDLFAELRADGIEGDIGAVLDGIVKEARGNGGWVDHELGEDGGDEGRVGEIRLTGLAELTFVRFFGELPGFFHEHVAVAGMIFADAAQHLVQGHCFVGCESHG